MLASGAFNNMSQVKQEDGSLLVTLEKRGDPKSYKLWVKNLYKPDEKVIKEEVTGND
jgi:hypothetical protein